MKFLKSNWREVCAIILITSGLAFSLLALGAGVIAESSTASMVVSVVAQLLGGITKFAACLLLAWAGLMITFPEANRFIVGDVFDRFWECCPTNVKGYIALMATGILAIVAALCMASS